ncbi:hypothetical protein LJB42_003739 [Komagataella kurtzmanii]|nr:hypothetical protein LJB42_003739 [Komagataella kurtzmanii]
MTKGVEEESFESGDLLEAFKRLNEGERTATELEKMLDSIESKIKKLEEVANFDNAESKPKTNDQ